MYDYREAMTEDVKEWIKENINLTEWTEDREGLLFLLSFPSLYITFHSSAPFLPVGLVGYFRFSV